MNDDILVSIIIPAYNTEAYIHRAIESSLRQTHKNVEILIIDDGSSDKTLETAQKYTDSRVKVFHQDNKGVSAARNYGIREAKGEYMIFLDSDDWLEDDAVEFLLDAQLKHPDKLITSNLCMVSTDIERNLFFRKKYLLSELSNMEEISKVLSVKLFTASEYWFIATLHCKIFQSKIIDDYNLTLNENFAHAEDQLFVFDYLKKTNGIFYLNKFTFNIFQRPGSSMRVPYNQRKSFINGRYNSFTRFLVDNSNDDSSIQRIFKIYHTKRMLQEIRTAISNGAELDKLNQLMENLRLYHDEYLKDEKISSARKIYLRLILHLPMPLVKLLVLSWNQIVKLKLRIKNYQALNNEETIPYW